MKAKPASARKSAAQPPVADPFSQWFPLALGLILGLAPLKFGNPVILNDRVVRPEGFLEWLIQAWPIQIGWVLVAAIFLFSAKNLQWREWKTQPLVIQVILAAPLLWLGWNGLASAQSVDPRLTRVTMGHFLFAVLMFYLGFFGLSRVKIGRGLAVPVILCFFVMLWTGFRQHYGGLEATRNYFYSQPGWENAPPELIQKLGSDRIFGTLVYPNAFAGAIILVGPFVLIQAWLLACRWRPVWRLLLVGVLAYMSAASLYWTGSKSGWLIVLAMAGIGILMVPLPRRVKISIVAVALVTGLSFFWIRYASYFREGAPSVAARFDYWTAAWNTGRDHPILGSGPGTFSVVYAKVKPPEAEMARLTHNDYLEQWSDAGFVAAGAYLVFVFGSLWVFWRKLGGWQFPVPVAIWLGLLGWAAQSFVEFGLYIPALAWPAFLFLGWGIKGAEACDVLSDPDRGKVYDRQIQS